MSIRMGDKILAANYKPNNATQDVAGLARLATEEEITEGIATESVVTPYQLKETVNNRANIDLNNLSETGEARFNGKANVNLDNLSNVGETHFNNKYVQKSGDTMTGTLTINTNKSTLLEEVLSNYTSPSSQDTINTLLRCKSSNNKTLCLLEYYQEGETRGVELSVRNSKLYSATLALKIDETGNTYATAPNPAEDSYGNNIATTAWTLGHSAFPSTKKTALTAPATNNSVDYTAPADGWFSFFCGSVTTKGNLYVINNTTKLEIEAETYSTGKGLGVIMPAHEGDVVHVLKSAKNTTDRFYFVYAQGR